MLSANPVDLELILWGFSLNDESIWLKGGLKALKFIQDNVKLTSVDFLVDKVYLSSRLEGDLVRT